MKLSRIFIYIIIGVILLIVFVPTTIKLKEDHLDKLYNVEILKIEEAAKKCYLEKKCQESQITLKTLKDLKYVEELINPKTNELFSDKIYIDIVNNKAVIHLD